MKIVISPDKFKGSLSGLEFCDAVERGIKKHREDVEIIKLPLADGGDGTVEVLQYYQGGEMMTVLVHDPLFRKIKASYLYSSKNKMAFIEMAEASGIRLLKNEELNPLLTSTYGTGELISNAIVKGARHIILGIGGSSTNDAGMGMAKALGYHFFDKSGQELNGTGSDLIKLHRIDDSSDKLKNVKFEVACDVDNPLFGRNGAAHVYAPQKGATPEMVTELDKGLQNFNQVVKNQFQKDLQNIKGAGAAGGLGAGCVLFLNAELKSGISLIKDVANFDEKIQHAGWLITGEGKIDEQTFSGKVIHGILESRTNQKLAVFSGISELETDQLIQFNIDFLAEIATYAKNTEDSIKNAAHYLEQAASDFAKEHLT